MAGSQWREYRFAGEGAQTGHPLPTRQKAKTMQKTSSDRIHHRALKSNYRMARNYLKGAIGDRINLLFAAGHFFAVFPCKKYADCSNLMMKIQFMEVISHKQLLNWISFPKWLLPAGVFQGRLIKPDTTVLVYIYFDQNH